MQPYIKPDDTIHINSGYFFNYYKRINKLKLNKKSAVLTIHLNRSRQITLFPNLLEMKIPVCIYGIYTNGCLFDYTQLTAGDKLKLKHFYPEIEHWLECYKKLKRLKPKKKKDIKNGRKSTK